MTNPITYFICPIISILCICSCICKRSNAQIHIFNNTENDDNILISNDVTPIIEIIRDNQENNSYLSEVIYETIAEIINESIKIEDVEVIN